MRKVPRILLAAASSGSGKTMITCGILQALKDRGCKVASFKCGPDYIDPMFHSRVIGTKSRNLDTFFTGRELTRYLLTENAADVDISVMEGVMGYYDGVAGTTTQASAYELASFTDTPTILIINCKGMSISMAAQIKGFLEFRKDSGIKGVILNQLSPMLYERMKKLIEEELPVKVLGYVPVIKDFTLESRHLGLVMPEEVPRLQEHVKGLAKVMGETLDMEAIIELAQSAPDMEEIDLEAMDEAFSFRLEQPVHLAVAYDEAFCFFYEDNFRLLKKMGAEITYFSPVHDEKLPQGTDGLLFYGGYPELQGKTLEENTSMKESIRSAFASNMPCMAECGGFMYLHETMENMDGEECETLGIIEGKVFRTPRLNRFGYITLEGETEVFGCQLPPMPAHEFHYFDSTNCGECFEAKKPKSVRKWKCMHVKENLFTGFPHFHYYANPKLAQAFLTACDSYRKEREGL